MSTFTNDPVPRLSVNFKFAYVPAMILPRPYEFLEPIPRPPPSDGAATTHKTASVTSTQAKAKDPDVRHRHKIPREEPCFITGSISYIHEQAHWVNAVRNKNTTMQNGRERPGKKQIEDHLFKLRVVPQGFNLDSPSNLTNLDRTLHKALDVYAFIAVTASDETLDALIHLVRKEKEEQYWASFTEAGDPGFSDLFSRANSEEIPIKFQLIALHPEHFLPAGSCLTIYHRDVVSESVNVKIYGAGSAHALDGVGRRLREMVWVNGQAEPDAPLLFQPLGSPPPDFSAPLRHSQLLNPFLVILNAGIKFRRYRRNPAAKTTTPVLPRPPLPEEVSISMNKTLYLIDLLYSNTVHNLPLGTDMMLTTEFSALGDTNTVTPNRLKRSRSDYEEPGVYSNQTQLGMGSRVDEFGRKIIIENDPDSTIRALPPSQALDALRALRGRIQQTPQPDGAESQYEVQPRF